MLKIALEKVKERSFVSPMLGANKEVGEDAEWTTFKEGATTDYWQGEE